VGGGKDCTSCISVVVRMEGTNVERGQQILRAVAEFHNADGMKDGAQKVVALAEVRDERAGETEKTRC